MPPVVKVEKLERIDECGLTGIVWADDLQRAREFDVRVIVASGSDEDKSLRSGWHGGE